MRVLFNVYLGASIEGKEPVGVFGNRVRSWRTFSRWCAIKKN